ncbi:Alpha/Beta hydrolase protein [Xylaria nigripes]|nr:Alpha/Beta hydrolase protein [Xylaria nigripes]
MDKLRKFSGFSIDQSLVPTFQAYEDLLKAKEADIRSARRETHSYGPSLRHLLDVYFPDDIAPAPQTVLVFLYGGGFYIGSRVDENYANGLIFGNIGRYFTAKFGVTVIVPDYRLLSHGAKYPSGGEDVSFVVDWVRSALASREGYENINLVLLGHSAGGTHAATYLLDPAFEASREAVTARGSEGRVRLRGVVFLGTAFHYGDQHYESVRAYLGEDTVYENAPISKLRAAVEADRVPEVKVLILVNELDPEILFDVAKEFRLMWVGSDVRECVLEGHNHLSPQLSLGTGIEREEAWGEIVAEFLRSCSSD